MVVAQTGWQGEILALSAGEWGTECERKQSGRRDRLFCRLSQWQDEIGKLWTEASEGREAGVWASREQVGSWVMSLGVGSALGWRWEFGSFEGVEGI